MERTRNRSGYLRLAIVWLAILLAGTFWLSVRTTSEPVILSVLPQAPREGEPVIATFKLNNPSGEPLVADYQFYANGALLREGETTVSAQSSKVYQYTYENALPMGEQLNFMVKTQSRLGDYEKAVSTPPYPPQVWSSFVSFASFSTSVMSSMSTMVYYQGTFATDIGLNIGIVTSAVLIALLIFLEMPFAAVRGQTAALGRLRVRLSVVTWILLIIFLGMVYTRVALIIAQ